MIWIYNIFFAMAFLFLFCAKKVRAGAREKFGFYDFNFSKEKNILWIHAISVGELGLVEDILKKNSDYQVVLTTSTPQGQELAKKKYSEYCKKITYFPYDFKFSVKSAIRHINPKLVLMAETEIWPEFSYQMHENNIPLIIFNGRISLNTFKSYRKLKFFFKNILKNYYAILTQSEEDKERFIEIGANKDFVQVMGNIKFDIKKPQNKIKDTLDLGQNRLIVAGSTHIGEDEIIFKTFKKLKEKYSDIKLLIVPRHLERVQNVQSLTSGGLKSNSTFKENDILILDTTGELKNIYSLSYIAFIGGSFNKTGGHNPLEATIWGIPVISGDNVKNFKLIYKNLCELNCAEIVHNSNELFSAFDKLLSDEVYYRGMQKNCETVFEKNAGATQYLLEFIKKINGDKDDN